MCSQNAVEDEIHFLCDCPAYSDHRRALFYHAELSDLTFSQKDSIDKFVYLMSNHQKEVIYFLTNAVYRRINTMYIINANND